MWSLEVAVAMPSVMMSAPSPPSTIFVPSSAVIWSLPPRSTIAPPAEVLDNVLTTANLLPTASSSTTPLSPSTVSLPFLRLMMSDPKPPRIVLFPSPVIVIVSPPAVPPVLADTRVSVVSYFCALPAPAWPIAT